MHRWYRCGVTSARWQVPWTLARPLTTERAIWKRNLGHMDRLPQICHPVACLPKASLLLPLSLPGWPPSRAGSGGTESQPSSTHTAMPKPAQFSICLSVSNTFCVRLSVSVLYVSVCFLIAQCSVCLPACHSLHGSVCLSAVTFFCLPVCVLPGYLSACLSISMPGYLSICLLSY